MISFVGVQMHTCPAPSDRGTHLQARFPRVFLGAPGDERLHEWPGSFMGPHTQEIVGQRLVPWKFILVKCLRFYIEMSGAKTQVYAWIEGPGRYREVGDAYRKNYVLIAPLNSFMVPSYDLRTEKVHEYEVNQYQMLSLGVYRCCTGFAQMIQRVCVCKLYISWCKFIIGFYKCSRGSYMRLTVVWLASNMFA